ncbi:hypothetical protein DSCO28_65110 [Desulfosarcina ovata subsp. sediminis]|uniref:Uncharacterized protein n=1 Tax=Desulfosarcina ovata subsp. sediminis TaxID=885957 RepID=A0A5K8A087_9BACT|nr:hypothetical protein DSCO28_65110 [Desulfosarcina ovata subsp. sediminis]
MHAFVIVDTIALPQGCTLLVIIRDVDHNTEVMREERAVGEGQARTSVRIPAPDENRSYHATVRVTKASVPQVDITSGAGLEWTR